MSPDGVQGQSPCERTCPPTGCRGRAPASIHTKTSFNRRARRAGGAAAAPAGRGLPKEARAARSLGKAKAGEDAARQARVFYKLTVFAIQYGGSGDVSPDGVQGRSHCINSRQNFFQPPSAASGRRSRRARRGAGFRRKREPRVAWGRQKSDISAMRSNGGSGDVSPDGMQGRSPCERTCPPTGCRGGATAKQQCL